MSKSKKEKLEVVKQQEEQSTFYYFYSQGCGFCKRAEPIVAEINKSPIEMLGHVASSYYSPNLNKSIALAIVRNGKKLKGTKLFVPMKNKTINVEVTDTVFLDKENSRLNAKL